MRAITIGKVLPAFQGIPISQKAREYEEVHSDDSIDEEYNRIMKVLEKEEKDTTTAFKKRPVKRKSEKRPTTSFQMPEDNPLEKLKIRGTRVVSDSISAMGKYTQHKNRTRESNTQRYYSNDIPIGNLRMQATPHLYKPYLNKPRIKSSLEFQESIDREILQRYRTAITATRPINHTPTPDHNNLTGAKEVTEISKKGIKQKKTPIKLVKLHAKTVRFYE